MIYTYLYTQRAEANYILEVENILEIVEGTASIYVSQRG